MSVIDHVQAVQQHTRSDIIQYALVNTELPSKSILARYRELKAEPVLAQAGDSAKLDEMGITLLPSRLAVEQEYFRHDPHCLAQVILKLIVI